MPTSIFVWLQRRAEDVAGALLLAMFIAFLVQIFMRYVLNSPVGWSTEVCALAWLWIILWGSGVVLRDSEEIRFDLVYESIGAKTRRLFDALYAVPLVILYGVSLPATISYISFMKVERSAYMDIRFDYLFSIYVVFACAVIVRYSRILWRSIRGNTDTAETADETGPGS